MGSNGVRTGFERGSNGGFRWDSNVGLNGAPTGASSGAHMWARTRLERGLKQGLNGDSNGGANIAWAKVEAGMRVPTQALWLERGLEIGVGAK